MNRLVGRGKMVPLVSTLALVLVLGWVVMNVAHGVNHGTQLAMLSGVEPGVVAPDFELEELEGGSISLGQFKGEKPVLVYFWATWCPHCVENRPEIVRLREKISEQKLEILAVNVGAGDSLARLKRFKKGHPMNWPVLYDGDGKVSKEYGVKGIPLYLLVNKEGVVVYRSHDLPGMSDLQQVIH